MNRVIAWSLAIFVFAVFVMFRLDFTMTHPRHDPNFAIPIQIGTSPAYAVEVFSRVRSAGTLAGFPRGVRNIGMGATGTADATSLSSGYFNPASVSYANATTLSGSNQELGLLIDDLELWDGVITSPIPFRPDSTSAWRFAGAFGYTQLDFPPQQERTIYLPEGTGRTVDFDEWMLSATAAASWTRGVVCLSAGSTAKMHQAQYADATLWAFDAGAIAAFPMDVGGGRVRPRLGYAALNLDSGQSYDNAEAFVPTESRGGFGIDVQAPPVAVMEKQVPSVTFALDYDRIDREGSSPVEFGAGVELSVVDLFHVRYGVIDDQSTTYGIGAGWDFGNVLFRLDYAHVTEPDVFYAAFTEADLDRDAFGALIGVRW